MVVRATIVDALSSLAHTHRLGAFRALVAAGPAGLAAGALATAVGLSPSALSFHLAHLSRAGLTSCRRDGRRLIYAADFAAMAALVGYLTENCCGGIACAAPQPERLVAWSGCTFTSASTTSPNRRASTAPCSAPRQP